VRVVDGKGKGTCLVCALQTLDQQCSSTCLAGRKVGAAMQRVQLWRPAERCALLCTRAFSSFTGRGLTSRAERRRSCTRTALHARQGPRPHLSCPCAKPFAEHAHTPRTAAKLSCRLTTADASPGGACTPRCLRCHAPQQAACAHTRNPRDGPATATHSVVHSECMWWPRAAGTPRP
jgi:hypothetical protein